MADRAPLFNDRREKPGKPKVYGMFHDPSYSPPMPDDAEEFSSMAHARRTFADRSGGRDRQFPAVSSEAEMHLFVGSHPKDMRDPYPDRIVKKGKRGGTRVERV